jgi:hypothetical protein
MAIPQPTFRGSNQQMRQQRQNVMQQGSAQLLQAIQHNRQLEEEQHQFNVLQEGALVEGLLANTYDNNIGMMASDEAGAQLLSNYLGRVARDTDRGTALTNALVNAPRTSSQWANEIRVALERGDLATAERVLREVDPAEADPPADIPVSDNDPAPAPEPRQPGYAAQRQHGEERILSFAQQGSEALTRGASVAPPRQDRVLEAFLQSIAQEQGPSVERADGGFRIAGVDSVDQSPVSLQEMERRLQQLGVNTNISNLEPATARQALRALREAPSGGVAGSSEMGTTDAIRPGTLPNPRAQAAVERAASTIETAFPNPEERNATVIRRHFDTEILGLPDNFNHNMIPSALGGTADRESYMISATAEAERLGAENPEAFAEESWNTVEERSRTMGFSSVEEMIYARTNLIRNSVDPNRPATSLTDVTYQPLTAVNLVAVEPQRREEELQRAAESRTGESAEAFRIAARSGPTRVDPGTDTGPAAARERERAYARDSRRRTDRAEANAYEAIVSPREQRIVEREADRITRRWRSTGAAARRARDPERRAAVEENTQNMLRAVRAMEGVSEEVGIDWLSVEQMPDSLVNERAFREEVRQFELTHALNEDRNRLGWAELELRAGELQARAFELQAAAEAAIQEMPEPVREEIDFARSMQELMLNAFVEEHGAEEGLSTARANEFYQELQQIISDRLEPYGMGRQLTTMTFDMSWWRRRIGAEPETYLGESIPGGSAPQGTEAARPEPDPETDAALEGYF